MAPFAHTHSVNRAQITVALKVHDHPNRGLERDNPEHKGVGGTVPDPHAVQSETKGGVITGGSTV